MTHVELKKCVECCKGKCKTEASGGITLEAIDAIVDSGIDAISIGMLTHSAPSANLSLEVIS